MVLSAGASCGHCPGHCPAPCGNRKSLDPRRQARRRFYAAIGGRAFCSGGCGVDCGGQATAEMSSWTCRRTRHKVQQSISTKTQNVTACTYSFTPNVPAQRRRPRGAPTATATARRRCSVWLGHVTSQTSFSNSRRGSCNCRVDQTIWNDDGQCMNTSHRGALSGST